MLSESGYQRDRQEGNINILEREYEYMNQNKLVAGMLHWPVAYLMMLSRFQRPYDAKDECQDGYVGNNT